MTMGQRIAVMSEGLLQQVGTPQTLYDTPINRFVAGFIGSPSMNFVEVHAEGSGEGARLVGPADWSIPMPDRYRQASMPHPGKTIIVGFRPEHLDIGHPVSARSGHTTWSVPGNEELLTSRRGAGHRRDRRLGARIRPGDIVDLVVPLDKLHRSTARPVSPSL